MSPTSTSTTNANADVDSIVRKNGKLKTFEQSPLSENGRKWITVQKLNTKTILVTLAERLLAHKLPILQ